MTNYCALYTNIWNDAKFTEYAPEQQLIFIYLISNPACKISGIYQVSPKHIAVATNINRNTVVDTLKSFDPKTLEYDAAAGIVFIKNCFKYNMNKIGNPNTMIDSLMKSASINNHDDFWSEFCQKYEEKLTSLMSRIKKFDSTNNTFLSLFLKKIQTPLKPDCKQSDSSLDPDFLSISISNNINKEDIKDNKEVKKIKKEKKEKEGFEEFWQKYLSGKINTPIGSKKKAREIYNKSKQTPEKILEGLSGYLIECEKKGTYTAAATTFLNQERYNDYLKSDNELAREKEFSQKIESKKLEMESIFKINKNSPEFIKIMSNINFLGTDSRKIYFSRQEGNKKIFITDTKFNRDWICSEYGKKIKEVIGDCILIAKEDPDLRRSF